MKLFLPVLIISVVFAARQSEGAGIREGSSQKKQSTVQKKDVKSDFDFFIGATLGTLNFQKSNGEGDYHSTYGGYGLVFYRDWLAGLKYDYYRQERDGTNALNIKNSGHLIQVELGRKFIDGEFGPYAAVGVGPYMKRTDTQVFSNVYYDYDSRLTYNLGVGVVGRVYEALALGFSIRYFPDSFINSLNFAFSAGYYF